MDINTLTQDVNLIGAKWVFKIKYKNGEYERHKARIVALGYQQRKNVDFFVSFSPTASYVSSDLRAVFFNFAPQSLHNNFFLKKNAAKQKTA